MTIAFSEQALREASEWFARLHGGDATAQDHVDLADWLASRQENEQAYGFVTETGRLAASAHRSRTEATVFQPERRIGPVVRRRTWIAAGGAAAAAAIVAAIGVAVLRPSSPQIYETAIGEIRNVKLSDGSVLILNGATKLTVSFTTAERNLAIDSGEFFVAVGKDRSRPFRVRAKGRVIEDVGTAFDVDTNGSQIDVAVSEGMVTISNPSGATADAGSPVTLGAGQSITFDTERALGVPRALQPQNVGAWRIGILSYDQCALKWLVSDLNRRFDRAIVIKDPALAEMPVTLTLTLHDRATTIGTLEKLLPIRALANADGTTELVGTKS